MKYTEHSGGIWDFKLDRKPRARRHGLENILIWSSLAWCVYVWSNQCLHGTKAVLQIVQIRIHPRPEVLKVVIVGTQSRSTRNVLKLNSITNKSSNFEEITYRPMLKQTFSAGGTTLKMRRLEGVEATPAVRLAAPMTPKKTGRWDCKQSGTLQEPGTVDKAALFPESTGDGMLISGDRIRHLQSV